MHASALHLQKLPDSSPHNAYQLRQRTLFYYVLTIFYFILLGLNEYTTFRVSVAANNSFGIGPYSQPVEVKTQESSKSIILLFFVLLTYVAALLDT